MLLNNEEIESRLSSPDNLINQMRNITSGRGMSLFGIDSQTRHSSAKPAEIVSMPVSVDNIIDNVSERISEHRATKGAAEVLANSLEILKDKLIEVDKPEKLSRIAYEMSRITAGFHEQRNNNGDAKHQVIIYKPVIMNESHYETISVQDE